MNKLTKAVLSEQIAESTGLMTKDVQVILNTFFEVLKAGLVDDRVIEFRGFGTFGIKTRNGRLKARNPQTGEIVSTKTHGVVNFRPGKELKASVWDIKGSE